MAVLGENGSMLGRPGPGQEAAGGSLESLLIRLRDRLKINEATDCWEWTGAKTRGYGVVRVGKQHLLYVHRTMLELVMGRPLAPGKCALHRCDNPPCGNPEHLFEGTKAVNNADMIAKGRDRWHRHA